MSVKSRNDEQNWLQRIQDWDSDLVTLSDVGWILQNGMHSKR